ncbi:MAG: hypothetical protein ACHQK9_03465 [Reyranellales bacterium]
MFAEVQCSASSLSSTRSCWQEPIAAAACAVPESRRRKIKRWWLLLLGLLASFSTAVVVAYPDILDLLQPEVWTLGLLAALVGAARGCWLGMDSDHVWDLVRLQRGFDSLCVAVALA